MTAANEILKSKTIDNPLSEKGAGILTGLLLQTSNVEISITMKGHEHTYTKTLRPSTLMVPDDGTNTLHTWNLVEDLQNPNVLQITVYQFKPSEASTQDIAAA